MINIIKQRTRANKQGLRHDVLAHRLNISSVSTQDGLVTVYISDGISITLTDNDILQLFRMTGAKPVSD